jgi:capsule biosynthesis phosphatase
MIQKEKCLVVDIDGTLCPIKPPGERYEDLLPVPAVVEQLRQYRNNGFHIILFTSRNMRTYEGNLGQILAHTAPVLLEWLKKHEIPFDEIHFGKPWAGKGGFYVDDRAVRPSEFLNLTYEQIQELLSHEQAVVAA